MLKAIQQGLALQDEGFEPLFSMHSLNLQSLHSSASWTQTDGVHITA